MFNQGNFVQIIGIGYQNHQYNIPKNISSDYCTNQFDNNFKLHLTQPFDVLSPEYLEITLTNNNFLTNDEEINRIMYNIFLKVKINEIQILNIPLRFLLYLNKSEICDNKLYINLSFDTFINEFIIRISSTQQPIFELTNTDDNFLSCNLISKGLCCFPLISNTRENIMQYISSVQLIDINGRNNFKCQLPFDGITKGFFIECENVDQINELKLLLNDNTRTHYNRFLIKNKCIKIHQKLLYFPLNYNVQYNDLTNFGFEGAVNLNIIKNSVLILNFDSNITKLTIYGLGSNILKYTYGFFSLVFNYNNIHIIQNYIETNKIEVTNNEQIIYKLIIDENKSTCSINLQELQLNSRYMNCTDCHNNFNEESLKEWISINNCCPLCRNIWLDYSIYINANKNS